MKLNPFSDNRPIPSVSINVKAKIKSHSAEENTKWNIAFGNIMKKPRTKLEFLAIGTIRTLDLSKITLLDIQPLLSPEDYANLLKIEDVFNTRITADIKAFILGVLRVPIKSISQIIEGKNTISQDQD